MLTTAASQAALTTYTSESSFRSALAAISSASLLEEDFNSFTTDTSINSSTTFNGFSAIANGPISRVDVSPFQTATQHPIDGTPYIYGSLSPSSGGSLGNTMTLTFPVNTFAFGADFADVNNIGNGTRLVFSTGESRTLPGTGQTQAFYGVISDTPFSSIELRTNSGDGIGIDNIIVAVPEPSSALLTFLASSALLIRKRR